jgi:D-threo-aldose 1-dehydrogenase
MSLPTADLGDSGIRTTPLGFGCATLFRAADPAQRSRLIHAAFDVGIRHFDVAPMYGLGRAERELGKFARFHRAELTIATKFGIRLTATARGLAHAQRPFRRAIQARPAVRDQVRNHAAAPSRLLYEKGGYDAPGARRSLQRSLRSLKTGYVDLLLLHDPFPGTVRSDEVSSFLEDARTEGLIRSWGITGAPEATDEVVGSFRRVPVRQIPDDIFASPLPDVLSDCGLITFGVIGGALDRIVQHVTADEPTRRRWRHAIGSDCGDPEVASSFLLRAALQANRSGVVLFGSTQLRHIETAAGAFEQSRDASPGQSDLDAFLSMVNEELRVPAAAERRRF